MKAVMSSSSPRVFISNLPEPFTEEELNELFCSKGNIVDVSVKWTMGFVEFDSQEAANKAIKELNKSKIGDRKINVMLAALANTLTTVSATSSASSTTKTPVCSRLFIGNLDEKMTRTELEAIFAPYGAVSSCEVKKSYGFVRMETLEAAVAARQALDRQKDHNYGKPLRIDFAEPRRKAKLFVGNLAESQSPEEMKEAFAKFGIVLDVSVMNGFGFVTYDDDADAQKAVSALHHTMLGGSKIKVEISTSDTKPGGSAKDDSCHRCGKVGHFARDCSATGTGGPPAKRPRGGASGGRQRAASPEEYPPIRYADPYGPGRDPYGYPRPDPYARVVDPYADAYPRSDPYGYPRESVTYPGYGRPVTTAYDLPYDRPLEGRRKPLMEVPTKPDRSAGRPPIKRRR